MLKMFTRIGVLLLLLICACSDSGGGGASACSASQGGVVNPEIRSAAACIGGTAGSFPCSNVELLSALRFCAPANDLWGWVDPATGTEYALLGIQNGTVFVDIDDPEDPIVVGFLATHSGNSTARDIKTLGNYAFIVSEANNHGLQIFDLTRLRSSAPKTTFFADAHFSGFATAHNIAINEETGFAYVVGSNRCSGGLYMLDLSNPEVPDFVGCFADDFYTHDTQCVVYHGQDLDYQGSEICFNSNENTVTIVDVSDKSAPVQIRRASYPGAQYTHQGWLTEDHDYFLVNDESDELSVGHNTRTYVWDVSDLDTAFLVGSHDGETSSTDHNLYIDGDYVYEANYTGGLQLLRTGNLANVELLEVGYFDTVPGTDGATLLGAWTAYPFLPSGTILMSDIDRGLFMLRADLDAIPECDDGLDNDGDLAVDFPADAGCSSIDDLDEGD